jgi:hypothetical protein
LHSLTTRFKEFVKVDLLYLFFTNLSIFAYVICCIFD